MSLLLQADTLSVASENLAEAVPVEKHYHYRIVTSGGLAGKSL
jgi:biopolymer transport protein ExbB